MLSVKVWINMKSYYGFIFFSIVFLIQRIQVSDTKLGRHKKIAVNLSDPKKAEILRKPLNSSK